MPSGEWERLRSLSTQSSMLHRLAHGGWCSSTTATRRTRSLTTTSQRGLPISKVFVKTIQADKASVSVGASHEICEMAVDPWLNSAYQDAEGTFWAGEICDPVEDDQYGYDVGGVLLTDFVTPNWFGHKNAVGDIDLQRQPPGPSRFSRADMRRSSTR